MRPSTSRHKGAWLFGLIFLLSLPIKLIAAQRLIWEVDFVPVVALGQQFFDGGSFPVYGTLSSVAAYNMPFLVWMQMPAMLFTRDTAAILIISQLIFNLVGSFFVYQTAHLLFDRRAAWLAALLFTFSEMSISGSYTAWAQLFLPGFTAIVIYCLFRWRFSGKAIFAACTILAATAAMMTHFSAALLYGVIFLFILIARAPLRWKGIAAGMMASALLLSPYLIFQIQRDFVDLRAFFSRQNTIPPEILASYADLREAPASSRAAPPAETTPDPSTTAPPSAESPSRLERGIERLIGLPREIFTAGMLAFDTAPRTLEKVSRPLFLLNQAANLLVILAFWITAGAGTARTARFLWQKRMMRLSDQIQQFSDGLVENQWGHVFLLILCGLAIIAGLIVTRAGPAEQPSYYMGLFSLQIIIAAYGLSEAYWRFRLAPRWKNMLLALFILATVGLHSLDRVLRVTLTNPAEDQPANLWLYSSMKAAADWIAADWSGGDELTVSYDISPEQRNLWWVAPWNTVDSSYRIGMAYDFLLENDSGLRNINQNPIGTAENPDYILVYERGLRRYDLDQYTIEQFGAIFLLKPLP